MPLQPWEAGTWKDTVRAQPNTLTRVIMKFEDYLGKFPYHCHILDHEDHEMMRQFQVTNDPANCNSDGICGPGEDCISCSDCGTVSGALCGNGLCEIGDGENYLNCELDCAGKDKGKGAFACGDPATGDFVDCSDPRCTDNYFCRTKARVPACCGDTLCEGQETAENCANDCAEGTTPPGGNCGDIFNRDECDADPSCMWEGGKRSGLCVDAPACTPTGAEGPFGDANCNDAIDNDCDGLIDGDDPECAPVCTPEPEGPFGDPTCTDGVDNDCDGLADAIDPDCQEPTINCTVYEAKDTCNAEPLCRWNNKRGCETR